MTSRGTSFDFDSEMAKLNERLHVAEGLPNDDGGAEKGSFLKFKDWANWDTASAIFNSVY